MSEAVMQRLKISREGVILIKSFEGFRPRAVRREDGQWMIGYGHTASAREGASVSESDAELLLQYDLIPVARAVSEVAAPLNQHQFDALASFAFSVGVDRFRSSDVLSRLNAGFAGEAADAMVGWPEPIVAETALRRRAAERALFVANPAWPVALADLLAAPLPPPVQAPVPAPVLVPADETAPTGAGAVAPLLAEAAPVLHQREPVDVDAAADAADEQVLADAAPVTEDLLPFPSLPLPPSLPLQAETESAAETAEGPTPDTAPDTTPDTTENSVAADEPPPPAPLPFVGVQMQRYSAYSGAIVGPLPGAAFSPLAGFSPAPAQPAHDAPSEAIVAPFASVEADTPVESADLVTPAAEAVGAEISDAEHAGTDAAEFGAPLAVPFEAKAEDSTEDATEDRAEDQSEPTPWYVNQDPAADAVQADSAPIAGPLPETGGEAAAPASEPLSDVAAAPVVDTARTVDAQAATFDAAPVELPVELPRFAASAPFAPVPASDPWPAITAATAHADGELVLNSSTETDVFASPRLIWPHGEQQGDETRPLFEDDGSLRLAPGNILRHETFDDVAPVRIPWGELAAYGLMGAFGLVSFGMSMAAFRRAAESSTGGDGVTLIAIVLAVIGAACVGVSAYNLYRRWGRIDEDQA